MNFSLQPLFRSSVSARDLRIDLIVSHRIHHNCPLSTLDTALKKLTGLAHVFRDTKIESRRFLIGT